MTPEPDVVLAFLEERAYTTRELAEVFDVSPASMRAALSGLAAAGVVKATTRQRWALTPDGRASLTRRAVSTDPPATVRSRGVEYEVVWSGGRSLDGVIGRGDAVAMAGLGSTLSGPRFRTGGL